MIYQDQCQHPQKDCCLNKKDWQKEGAYYNLGYVTEDSKSHA